MKKKLYGAVAVATAATMFAAPASVPAQELDPQVETSCQLVMGCVNAVVDYAQTVISEPPPLGTVVDTVCWVIYKQPCNL